MLHKPVAPVDPVIVKDTVVVALGWYDVIVTLDIWELAKFPLIARSTVVPSAVVAATYVPGGFGLGDGVGVGVVAFVGVWVGEGVGDAFGFGVGVGEGVGAAVTVNELLVPVWVLSVAVILTPEPAAVRVTEIDPTPPTKAFIVVGLIDPGEAVRDGELV